MVRVLSGENMEISLPLPTKNEVLEQMAKDVVQSEIMSTSSSYGISTPASNSFSFRPLNSLAYSIR